MMSKFWGSRNNSDDDSGILPNPTSNTLDRNVNKFHTVNNFMGNYFNPFANFNNMHSEIIENNIDNKLDTNATTNINITQVEEERKQYTVRGLSGLKNIGNTCYMNATLQCLNACIPFSAYMINGNYEEKLRKNRLNLLANIKRKNENINEDVCVTLPKKVLDQKCDSSLTFSLYNVLLKMWEANSKITPKSFKQKIGELCLMFRGYTQNDSHELLNFILDTVHEETKVNVRVKFQNPPKGVIDLINVRTQCYKLLYGDNMTPEKINDIYTDYKEYRKQHSNDVIILEAYTYWKKYVQNSHSIITDLFTGLFCSIITCKQCNAKSHTFEPFTILSLPTKETGDSTLNECIQEFSKEEILAGDNQYFCEYCNTKTDAIKNIYIWELPDILIIQLKRFKNEGIRTSKTSSKVVFPINDLIMTHTLTELNISNKTETKYNLCAISEHRGTCNFGHYIAYAKNGLNNEWYEFDDDDIFHIPKDDLEKELINKNAYILFYIKSPLV